MQFKCSTKVYQFSGNPSNVYEINIVTGQVTFIKTLGVYVNAVGYNPVDNYIYGSAPGGKIYRIDSEYNYTLIPTPTGYPNSQFNTGAFDTSGYYYLNSSGSNIYYTIDLNPARTTYGKIVDPQNGYVEITSVPYFRNISGVGALTGVPDWAWNTMNNTLCGLRNSGDLVCVDPLTGIATIITPTGAIPAAYGAASSFINGDIYFPTNNTKQIIKVVVTSLTTATAEEFAVTDVVFAENDATSCILAELLVDYGDAPDTSVGNGPNDYSTLLANNGPRHEIVDGLRLGTLITGEADAYENPTATGDDLIQGIQDDALTLSIPELLVGQSTYSLKVQYTNSIGKDANLYGWIDFNRDGIFELNEKADLVTVSSSTTENPREVTLNFTVPTGVILVDGQYTFIRLRITTENLINTINNLTSLDTRSIGPAEDGEVEDYQIFIKTLSIEGTVWYDTNCNGINDLGEPKAEGILVELYSSNNLTTPIAFTTTDVNGFYQFNNLAEGNYYVKVIKPNGYNYTLTNIGSNDLVDSDINKNSGFSDLLYLNRDNSTIVVDSGLCKCNKISGQAFYDCNGDSLLDYKDSYLCGVTVILLNSNSTVVGNTITDCDGYYEFDNLCPDNYTVQTVAPPDMNLVTQNSAQYYGSKPSTATSNFQVPLTTTDYLQGFIGFKGNSIVDKKYCISQPTCNPSLTNDCSDYSYPNTCKNCDGTCEGCTNNCNGKCLGCNTCRPSNRENGQSCSKCDNQNCGCCDK